MSMSSSELISYSCSASSSSLSAASTTSTVDFAACGASVFDSRCASAGIEGRARATARMASMATAAAQRELRPVDRSEEHTSELQSQSNLVCRLLLEKKNNNLNCLFNDLVGLVDAYCL